MLPAEHFEYLITREEISPVSEFLWRYHNRHEKYDATGVSLLMHCGCQRENQSCKIVYDL